MKIRNDKEAYSYLKQLEKQYLNKYYGDLARYIIEDKVDEVMYGFYILLKRYCGEEFIENKKLVAVLDYLAPQFFGSIGEMKKRLYIDVDKVNELYSIYDLKAHPLRFVKES